MAADSLLTRLLDGTATACYSLNHNTPTRRLLAALVLLSISGLLFIRPDALEQQLIAEVTISELSSAKAGSFVRVSGFLVTADAYRTRYQLREAHFTEQGYAPLISEDKSQVVWVRGANLSGDETISAEHVSLVGQVVLGQGDQQPALYLRVGWPTEVLLAQGVAWLSRVLLAALLSLAGLAWLAARLDYALPLPWPVGHTRDAPTLLWFGSLGRPFSEYVVRGRPVQLALLPHEARFESPNGWAVTVRRLRRAHLFEAATRYGGLPAMRLHFEDERGLPRRGVLATNSHEARQTLLQALSLIRR